ESPRRNQSSSTATDLKWIFLVVTSGKPPERSKRIWYPKTLVVPVPVRSLFGIPWSRTCRTNSSYCAIRPKIAARPAGTRDASGREGRRVGALFDDDPAVVVGELVRSVHRDHCRSPRIGEEASAERGELAFARQPELERAPARCGSQVLDGEAHRPV